MLDTGKARVVAPVVVKADMASKNALLSPTGVAQNMNGIMPNSENTIHTEAVSKKPSRLPINVERGLTFHNPNPAHAVIAAVAAKISQSLSP